MSGTVAYIRFKARSAASGLKITLVGDSNAKGASGIDFLNSSGTLIKTIGAANGLTKAMPSGACYFVDAYFYSWSIITSSDVVVGTENVFEIDPAYRVEAHSVRFKLESLAHDFTVTFEDENHGVLATKDVNVGDSTPIVLPLSGGPPAGNATVTGKTLPAGAVLIAGTAGVGATLVAGKVLTVNSTWLPGTTRAEIPEVDPLPPPSGQYLSDEYMTQVIFLDTFSSDFAVSQDAFVDHVPDVSLTGDVITAGSSSAQDAFSGPPWNVYYNKGAAGSDSSRLSLVLPNIFPLDVELDGIQGWGPGGAAPLPTGLISKLVLWGNASVFGTVPAQLEVYYKNTADGVRFSLWAPDNNGGGNEAWSFSLPSSAANTPHSIKLRYRAWSTELFVDGVSRVLWNQANQVTRIVSLGLDISGRWGMSALSVLGPQAPPFWTSFIKSYEVR